MNRIKSFKYNEDIQEAYRIIPKELHKYLQVDWLLEANPLKEGLHNFREASFNRSYENTSHFVPIECQINIPQYRRNPTVVLLSEKDKVVDTVVHELGHALDYYYQEITGGWRWDFEGPTWYGKTNRDEAFAENFCVWLNLPNYIQYRDELDPYADKLFREMCKY